MLLIHQEVIMKSRKVLRCLYTYIYVCMCIYINIDKAQYKTALALCRNLHTEMKNFSNSLILHPKPLEQLETGI